MDNWFTKGLASLAVPMMIAVYYLAQPNGDQIVLITGLLMKNEVLVVITAAIFCLLVLVNSRRKW